MTLVPSLYINPLLGLRICCNSHREPYLSLKPHHIYKMASNNIQLFLGLVVVTLVTLLIPTSAQLSPHFYDKVCPQALPVIKSVIHRAILRERRIGASLLRLHFHDCFVNVSFNIKHSWCPVCKEKSLINGRF